METPIHILFKSGLRRAFMDFAQLHTFLEIVRLKSFSKAARPITIEA